MTAWLNQTLVATTLLMVAVLVLRAPARRAFGSGAAYAPWLVPLLRVALPSIERPVAVMSNVAAPLKIVQAATTAVPADVSWLPWVWALGAAAFGARHLVAYRLFVRRALAQATAIEPGGIAVVTTRAVEGPAAVGLLTRRILLPTDFATRFDPTERALALRHEHVHHARGDLWANAAALGMLALHWFNPLAYLAHRAFREDQELACDAAVIARAAAGWRNLRERHGEVRAEARGGRGTDHDLPHVTNRNPETEIEDGTHAQDVPAGFGGGVVAVGLATIAGLTLTATSGIAAEPVVRQIIVKRVTGADAGNVSVQKEVDARCGTSSRFETDAAANGAAKTSSKLILCRKAGANAEPGDRLAVLQSARVEILKTPELDAKQRSQAFAAIDDAIETLRTAD